MDVIHRDQRKLAKKLRRVGRATIATRGAERKLLPDHQARLVAQPVKQVAFEIPPTPDAQDIDTEFGIKRNEAPVAVLSEVVVVQVNRRPVDPLIQTSTHASPKLRVEVLQICSHIPNVKMDAFVLR